MPYIYIFTYIYEICMRNIRRITCHSYLPIIYYMTSFLKHSSVTIQYRHHTVGDDDAPWSSKRGKDSKKDEFYFFLAGLDSVNFGNKVWVK